MPYMPCKHTGCNETVQVPNRYCGIHTPKKEESKHTTTNTKHNPKKTTK